MEKEDRCDAITINPAEGLHLPFAHTDQPQDQDAEQHDDQSTAQESPLLAHRTKNEIGALLRHEVEFRLGPLEKALA